MMALDLQAGDEVIVPAFTWPSTAHVVVQAGGVPVFVDVDPETFALRVEDVVALLTSRTRAVIPVHLFGAPAPAVELAKELERRAPGVKLVEDAACAIGTRDQGRLAGTIGWLGCISLHPRKIITTGEGGLVVCGDPALARRLKRLRNHGMEPADGVMTFLDAGLNYRLTELGGALGVGQMRRLPAILARRAELGRYYLSRLAEVPGIEVPTAWSDPGAVFQAFVVRWTGAAPRAELLASLRGLGIECTIGTYSCVEQPYYREGWGTDPSRFAGATRLARQAVSLPLHPGMGEHDVDTVVAALRTLTPQLATRATA
jgi:dTDP-4-amino-4,6-dideoxygalactose transaminase